MSTASPGEVRHGPYTDGAERFKLFADVYHAAAQLGLSPREVDGLELWQVAAVLGMDYDRHSEDDDTETPGDLIAAHLERERLRDLGRLDEFYVADDRGLS